MRARTWLRNVAAGAFNGEPAAIEAFRQSVVAVVPEARTTEDVVARRRRRRRLEDADEAAEVEFLVVVDEVADDGAASASAAGEVFDSVMALLEASLDDATLQAALVGAAEDSGSAALADVEVDVEASRAALEDASYTFSIATRPPTLAPTNDDGDDDSLVLGAGLILGAGLVVRVGALVVAFLVLALVVVVIVRCTSTSKRGERPSAAFEMGSAFPMPASPVGAWKGKERDSEMI